ANNITSSSPDYERKYKTHALETFGSDSDASRGNAIRIKNWFQYVNAKNTTHRLEKLNTWELFTEFTGTHCNYLEPRLEVEPTVATIAVSTVFVESHFDKTCPREQVRRMVSKLMTFCISLDSPVGSNNSRFGRMPEYIVQRIDQAKQLLSLLITSMETSAVYKKAWKASDIAMKAASTTSGGAYIDMANDLPSTARNKFWLEDVSCPKTHLAEAFPSAPDEALDKLSGLIYNMSYEFCFETKMSFSGAEHTKCSSHLEKLPVDLAAALEAIIAPEVPQRASALKLDQMLSGQREAVEELKTFAGYTNFDLPCSLHPLLSSIQMSTWPLLTNDSIAGQTDILAVVKVMGAQLFEKFQPGATSASAAINEIVVDTGKVKDAQVPKACAESVQTPLAMSHLSALDGTRDNKESGSITMAEFIRKVAAAGSSLDERAKALADCAPQRPKEETYERELDKLYSFVKEGGSQALHLSDHAKELGLDTTGAVGVNMICPQSSRARLEVPIDDLCLLRRNKHDGVEIDISSEGPTLTATSSCKALIFYSGGTVCTTNAAPMFQVRSDAFGASFNICMGTH
ncbi:unnamed protein product, partial [Prorocentrum cordatum]